MHVEIFSTDNPPTGVGEAGVPVIAPAIANALARLPGGKRVRSLPLMPALRTA
jgi:isoquinoline 1-oxidoreductase beta subunit